jgi:Zn-dependent oligopeptidase
LVLLTKIGTNHLLIEMAQILGFPNWASYNLLPKMANTTEAVFSFLNDLHEILKDKLNSEIAKLLELKKSHVGSNFDGKINSWDYSFYQSIFVIIVLTTSKN